MMDKLRLLSRKAALDGAVVIRFDCRGCMGEDHQLEWIGRVTGFKNQREVFGPDAEPLTLAIIQVIKRNDNGPLGTEHAVVEDLSLQHQGQKLWFYYK